MAYVNVLTTFKLRIKRYVRLSDGTREMLVIILILNLPQWLLRVPFLHLIQVGSGQTTINLIIVHLNTLLQ